MFKTKICRYVKRYIFLVDLSLLVAIYILGTDMFGFKPENGEQLFKTRAVDLIFHE